VKRLAHESKEFLKYLDNRGLQIGSEIVLENIEEFDLSMVVIFEENRLVLSEMVCGQLLVEVI
jgi:hypothetical protein